MDMYDPSMTMDYSSSNFDTQRTQFVQGCAGFAAGATAAVILRLFARWKHSTSMAADDLSISLSLIPLWALSGTGIAIAMRGGLGQNYDTLTPDQAAVFYPAAFAAYILYALAITAAKLSILLLYRRIFTSRPFRTTLYVFMAICLVWCILVVFLAIFRCQPIASAWSTNPADRVSCIPLRNLYYGTSSSNILLDILINILPARQIWHLQLPIKQRVLLVICMCLGIVSIAAGMGRLLTIPSLLSENLPASIAMPFLFVVIEPSFAIICACLPTYRPLALWVGHTVSSSRAGSKVKSLFSTQSMDGSRKSRTSGMFAKRPGASVPQSEKKGLLAPASASSSPEIDREKSTNDSQFDNRWDSSQRGTNTTVSVGRAL